MVNETVPSPEGPSMAQALVMLGSGIVLGFGGCSAFLSSLTSGSGEAWTLGGAAFVLGVILTIIGAIRLSRAMRGT
jgi:hypothetical protein